jgi:hypothetical protein
MLLPLPDIAWNDYAPEMLQKFEGLSAMVNCALFEQRWMVHSNSNWRYNPALPLSASQTAPRAQSFAETNALLKEACARGYVPIFHCPWSNAIYLQFDYLAGLTWFTNNQNIYFYSTDWIDHSMLRWKEMAQTFECSMFLVPTAAVTMPAENGPEMGTEWLESLVPNIDCILLGAADDETWIGAHKPAAGLDWINQWQWENPFTAITGIALSGA